MAKIDKRVIKKIRGSEKHKNYSQDEKKFLKKIGLKIQQEIRANGNSIERFCFDHGIPRSGMSELIAGRRDPQLVTLRRIVQKMGYKDIEDFLRTL